MVDPNFEQMQFNLYTPANPMNMATRFKLRPAPIVLQRVSMDHGDQQAVRQPQTMMPFDQRMELASRLAQRELEKNPLNLSRPENTSLVNQFHGRDELSGNEGVERRAESSHSRPAGIQKKPHQETTTISENNKRRNAPVGGVTSAKDNHELPSTGIKKNRNEVTVGAADAVMESEIASATQEILRLRKDLNRKMQRLKVLSLRADLESPFPPPPPVATTSSQEGGRLAWIDEDKSSKRERNRTHGQAVRNARLLYQLQQKIREAQKDLRVPNLSTKSKLLAMHRLASAHRTAIRTLHHLMAVGVSKGVAHGSSHDEVSGLIEQLSRLCIEAHVGGVSGAGSEDERATALLKELSEYHAHVKTLLQKEHPVTDSRSPHPLPPPSSLVKPKKQQQRSVNQRNKRKKMPREIIKRRGVLLDPQLRSDLMKREKCGRERKWAEPSFARQTFASIQKCSPRKQTNPSLALLASSSPCIDTFKSTPLDTQTHPPSSQVPHPSHPPHSQQPSHPSPSRSPVLPHPSSPSPPPPSFDPSLLNRETPGHSRGLPSGGVAMPWEHEGQNLVEKEMARQLWLDRRTLELAEHMEKKIKGSHNGRKEEDHVTVVEDERVFEEHKTRKNHQSDKGDELINGGLVPDTTNDGDTETSERMVDGRETELTIQTPGIQNMMERIQEMERERSALQRRWQTISYETVTSESGNLYSTTDPAVVTGSDSRVNIARPTVSLHLTSNSCVDITAPSFDASSPGSSNITRTTDPIYKGSNTGVSIARPSVNITRPKGSNRGATAVPITKQTMSDLEEYQERYSHYVRMVGIKTRGVFNQWELIDSLCNEIFEEVLQDTACEIQSTVDSCIDDLFNNEFHDASL